MSKVLVLRTCRSNMTSYGGFIWPTEGPVEAPDWKDDFECGCGLHGALWGEGDGRLLGSNSHSKWLVVEVEEDNIRDLGGKVKFPRGNVVFCGNQLEATTYLAERSPPGKAIIGVTITVGDGETAIVGYGGTATAGHRGNAIAGREGTAVAGNAGMAKVDRGGKAQVGAGGIAISGGFGVAKAGYEGTAIAGDGGVATAGYGGHAIVGRDGYATVGDNGIASVGEWSTAAAGKHGEIRIRWWDGKRSRLIVGYVGEDGIEPNTPYRCDNGKLEALPKQGPVV